MDGSQDVVGCEACDLLRGRTELPGGQIHTTTHWVVEHCVGPLGLGTLIVKPARHVTAVAGLSDDEARELGPLLRDAALVAERLTTPQQVYTCLWSHAGGEAVHIHYVVQPVTQALMDTHSTYGPLLQIAMFAAGDSPPDGDIERIATAARAEFAALG